MLPERIGVVVLLVNRQRQRQIAVQLVENLPFETREGQLVCARACEQAYADPFRNNAPTPVHRSRIFRRRAGYRYRAAQYYSNTRMRNSILDEFTM